MKSYFYWHIFLLLLYDNYTNIKRFDQESHWSTGKVIVSLEIQVLFNQSVFHICAVRTEREQHFNQAKIKYLFLFVTMSNPFNRGSSAFVSDNAPYQHFPTANKLKEEEKEDFSIFHMHWSMHGWQMFKSSKTRVDAKLLTHLHFF